MNIFTFGDSHCYNAWDEVQVPSVRIISRHIGPKLMYSFGQEGLSLLNIKNHGVQNGDVVVFCFGEIDVRCHVFKFRENFKIILESIVKNYMEAVEANIKQFSNLTTCIYFVPPVVEKETVKNNPHFPYEGEDKERQEYVLYMNQLLLKNCIAKQYLFIDLYDQYCNQNGFLNKAMSDAGPHIKEVAPLKKFIIEIILPIWEKSNER